MLMIMQKPDSLIKNVPMGGAGPWGNGPLGDRLFWNGSQCGIVYVIGMYMFMK